VEPYLGGQAIVEGVMMRSANRVAYAVRKQDNELHVETETRRSYAEKYPILAFPVIRGSLVLFESTILGIYALTKSTNLSSGEEEQELRPWEITLTLLGALAAAVLLFVWIPVFAASRLTDGGGWFALVEGVIRLAGFTGYVWLIGRMKDMQRVFGYHGAEHKTINCCEAGDPLTVENVRRHSIIHKRCGTSFLLFVMLLSVAVFAFVSGESLPFWFKVTARILLLPLIADLSYELIRWSAGHSGPLAAWLVSPGLLMQKLTTREPDDAQIEVAIASVLAVLEPQGNEVLEEAASAGEHIIESNRK
jgi:uncharacterized protein YqhQ